MIPLDLDEGDWTPEELQGSLSRSREANGWNEPGMEDYDHYDERCDYVAK